MSKDPMAAVPEKPVYLDFREATPDEGSVDMAACVRAYRQVGYDGVLCPDHVPFFDVDPGRERFFALCLGYTKAVADGVTRCPWQRPCTAPRAFT